MSEREKFARTLAHSYSLRHSQMVEDGEGPCAWDELTTNWRTMWMAIAHDVMGADDEQDCGRTDTGAPRGRPMTSKSVWCVQHRGGWCATYRGRRPDPRALSDQTRCGHFVVARIGSERGEPDCVECRVKMGIFDQQNGGDHG